MKKTVLTISIIAIIFIVTLLIIRDIFMFTIWNSIVLTCIIEGLGLVIYMLANGEELYE